MTNNEKIEMLRVELSTNPRIELTKFYTDSILTEDVLSRKLRYFYNEYTEGEETPRLSNEVKNMALSFNTLYVTWSSDEHIITSTIEFSSLTLVLLEHIKVLD